MCEKDLPQEALKLLRAGDVFQGCLVLAVRPGGAQHLQYILCQNKEAPSLEYVSWCYNAATGGAFWGRYFNKLSEAAENHEYRPQDPPVPAPQTTHVWFAEITHKYGTDQFIARTEAACNRQIEEYVQQNWSELRDAEPLDEQRWKSEETYRDTCVKKYQEEMGEKEKEFFEAPRRIELGD